MIKNKKTTSNYDQHKYRQQQAGCPAQVSPLIGRSKYFPFSSFSDMKYFFFSFLTTNRGATQKNSEETKEV
jgi:hypothetical protein